MQSQRGALGETLDRHAADMCLCVHTPSRLQLASVSLPEALASADERCA